MRRLLFIILVLILASTGVVFVAFQYYFHGLPQRVESSLAVTAKLPDSTTRGAINLREQQSANKTSDPSENKANTSDKLPLRDVLIPVPFVPQAPTAEWSNDVFQNGCEEAAVMMGVGWITGRSWDAKAARAELIALAEFEKKQYGESKDTNAADTLRFMKDYYHVERARIVESITIDQIQQELMAGHIILAPTNGRLLQNPNYTAPGPLQHFLVIRGYDVAKRQFITNDSGTRKGEGYRYDEHVLFAALREYPSGDHLPINDESKKTAIILEK